MTVQVRRLAGASIFVLLSACRTAAEPEPVAKDTGAATQAAAKPGPTSPYCKAPSTLVAKPEKCRACQAANCDPPVAKGCEGLASEADRASCEKVLTCVRSTNCIERGAVACYCGTVDIVSCKADAANAKGACKAEITAAYPANSTAAYIIDNSTKTDAPGPLALAIGQCDFAFCGPPAWGGHSECVPYCKP